jgi:hypothetical protein
MIFLQQRLVLKVLQFKTPVSAFRARMGRLSNPTSASQLRIRPPGLPPMGAYSSSALNLHID